jgi:hypothetical protein
MYFDIKPALQFRGKEFLEEAVQVTVLCIEGHQFSHSILKIAKRDYVLIQMSFAQFVCKISINVFSHCRASYAPGTACRLLLISRLSCAL